MSFFEKVRHMIPRTRTPTNSSGFTLSEINEYFKNGGTFDAFAGSDLSEITYFTCLKALSESVAKLGLHLKDGDNNKITDHDTYKAIRIRPNSAMTPADFKLSMEFCRNHFGNAYAYIQYDKKGRLNNLFQLPSQQVNIWVNNTDEFTNRSYYYRYVDSRNGNGYWISPEQMIHVKGGISRDGYSGMCVREILARNMAGNKASQNFLNDLYKQGLTANAVVKYVGDLDKKKKGELIKELKEFGSKSSDRIIPLPLGMDIVPLDLKLTDSQFFELKKFSSLQIAAAFGVKPNQLNNYEKSSYANSEMQNLSFYIDTLLINLTRWEEELNYKLLTETEIRKGLSFEFNVSTILRGDIKTQSEALRSYVSSTIYSPNDARRFIGQPPKAGGDDLLVNGSYVKLQDVGINYPAKGVKTE